MNYKFKRLLKEKGWQERQNPVPDGAGRPTGRFYADHVKVFTVQGVEGPKNIPISVSFWGYNKDLYPINATFQFVLKPELKPSYSNASAQLKGAEKIICLIDQTGMMQAMKFELFGFPAKYFKPLAKKELHKYNALPV